MTAEQIAAAYDEIAEDIWESPSLYRDVMRIHRPRSGRVLDIGCGQGRFLEMIHDRYGKKVTELFGCDISPRLVEMARERVPSADFRVANALCLKDYATSSFDHVYMIGSLEHMIDHQKAVNEAARVLRPNGIIVIAVPNAKWINYEKWKRHRHKFQPVDDYWFDPDELRAIISKAGLVPTVEQGVWAMYRGNWIHRFEMLAADITPFINLHRRMKLIGVMAYKPNHAVRGGFSEYIPLPPVA